MCSPQNIVNNNDSPIYLIILFWFEHNNKTSSYNIMKSIFLLAILCNCLAHFTLAKNEGWNPNFPAFNCSALPTPPPCNDVRQLRPGVSKWILNWNAGN